MVDKFCFVVAMLMMCFSCMCLGWRFGYDDAKKKYGRNRHG